MASGSEAEISSSPDCSSKWTFSSASIYCLFREEVQDVANPLGEEAIHDVEVGGKGENRENHHGCGALHLLAARPRDAAHLELQLIDVILRPLSPYFYIGSHNLPSRTPKLCGGGWQGRRDSNPHSRFWRPLV